MSIILFSINNLLWKINLKKINVLLLVSFRAFFTFAISFFILIISIDYNIILNYPHFRISIGSLFGVSGLFLMLFYLKNASLQWLGIYNLIGIVFTAFYLYYYENVNISDSILGYFLIFLGFIYYLVSNRTNNNRINMKQHFTLVLMIVCFGIASILNWKNLNTEVPAILIICNQEFFVFLISLSSSFLFIKEFNLKSIINKYFINVLFMAFIIFLAVLFSLIGLKITNPLISSVLFLLNPLLTIFFGNIILKENLNLKNIISIIMIGIGSFLIHFNLN